MLGLLENKTNGGEPRWMLGLGGRDAELKMEG